MQVHLPDAYGAYKVQALSLSDTRHEQCWDVVGEPLNVPIRETVPDYNEKLELGNRSDSTSKRGLILDLFWGRIEQDGAALTGVGAAMENLAETINANLTELEAEWSGESFEAFKAAMVKIVSTLTAYGDAAKTIGEVLIEAMRQVRELYGDYAERSAEMLKFDKISSPELWIKMDFDTGLRLADACGGAHPCQKNEDEQRGILDGQFTTDRLYKICEADPCSSNAGRVNIMYNRMCDEGERGRNWIRDQIKGWYDSTDSLITGINELYDTAIGNLYKLSSAEVFSDLRLVGGAAGGQPADTGDVSGGGGGSPGGGYPGGGGGGGYAADAGAEPIVDPGTATEPAPEPPATDTEPAATAPDQSTDPAAPDAATGQQETVEIKDGDRTISVTSPDGEGHVKVTVDDGTGKTKTYDLDFDAASGMAPRPPATDAATGADFGPDGQAAVGPDGQPVVGPDGQPVVGSDGQPAVGPDGQPVADAEQVPARSDGKCVIQDGPLTITAERPLFAPDTITLAVDDGSGTPTTYTLDFADAADADASDPGAAPAAATAGPGGAASSQQASAGATATDQTADPAAEAQPNAADPTAEPAAGAQSTTAEPAASAGPVAAEPATDAAHATTAQAWTGDQSGSVSGVLVPDQPDGEAGLASASDDAEPKQAESGGMAGGGMPMMGAPGGGGAEAGRAGSGWSVHGDLFDTTEPVYSMHGVLGNDDRDVEQ